MSHPVEDFNRILEIWGRILDAECVLLGFMDDQMRPTVVHEWTRPGSPPGLLFPPDHDLTAYAWAMERLRRNEIILLDSLSIPPAEAAAERQYLADRRLLASAWIPILASSGQLRGVMGVATTAETTRLKAEDVQFLRISSELIGNYLAAATAERDLRLSEQRLHRMNQTLIELTRSAEFVDADPERLLQPDGVGHPANVERRARLVVAGPPRGRHRLPRHAPAGTPPPHRRTDRRRRPPDPSSAPAPSR